jgi:hypothetical protein
MPGCCGNPFAMIVIPVMEVVDQGLDVLHEAFGGIVPPRVVRPIGGVQIFDDVDATFGETREERPEAGSDVPAVMAAIIKDDIHAAHLVRHPAQEGGVCLRADADLTILPVKPGTVRSPQMIVDGPK